MLLNFAEKYHHISDWKLNAYITLANIANDDEIDKLPGLHKVIQEIIHVISLGAKAMKQGLSSQAIRVENEAKIFRRAIPIKDSTEPKEVCMITLDIGNTGWSMSELFEGLYHMAVNDSVKNDIYSKYSMREYLGDIIYNGNPTEVAYAVKFLWQLCFDQRVLESVNEDKKLVEFIKQLETSPDKAVSENSKGMIFRLESHNNEKNKDNKPTTTKSDLDWPMEEESQDESVFNECIREKHTIPSEEGALDNELLVFGQLKRKNSQNDFPSKITKYF